MGRLVPITIQHNIGIVLHIANQYGSAYLYFGRVRLRILHREVKAVLFFRRGIQQSFSRHVDRTVRRRRTLRFCSRNNSVFPNGNIGVILVGKDAYAGTEAKSRGFRCIVAALIGAFYLILDILNAALAV